LLSTMRPWIQPGELSVTDYKNQNFAASSEHTADHEANSREVDLPAHCCEPTDKIA
jgi:hypothetical protein